MPDEIIVEVPNLTPEEYKKYRGKDVAIYKGRIVSSGRTSTEAFHNAKKVHPEAKTEEIEISYIPDSYLMIV